MFLEYHQYKKKTEEPKSNQDPLHSFLRELSHTIEWKNVIIAIEIRFNVSIRLRRKRKACLHVSIE